MSFYTLLGVIFGVLIFTVLYAVSFLYGFYISQRYIKPRLLKVLAEKKKEGKKDWTIREFLCLVLRILKEEFKIFILYKKWLNKYPVQKGTKAIMLDGNVWSFNTDFTRKFGYYYPQYLFVRGYIGRHGFVLEEKWFDPIEIAEWILPDGTRIPGDGYYRERSLSKEEER